MLKFFERVPFSKESKHLSEKHFMSRYEFLSATINENKYRTVAEIGVNKGQTTKYLLEHCDLKTYVLVDNKFNSKLEEELKEKDLIKKCYTCPEPVMIEKMNSIEVARKYEDSFFDLVFIDASHDYKSVREDILAWKDKVRERGILCGHDFFKSGDKPYSEVTSAVKSIFDWINLVSDESPGSDRAVWWRYM